MVRFYTGQEALTVEQIKNILVESGFEHTHNYKSGDIFTYPNGCDMLVNYLRLINITEVDVLPQRVAFVNGDDKLDAVSLGDYTHVRIFDLAVLSNKNIPFF